MFGIPLVESVGACVCPLWSVVLPSDLHAMEPVFVTSRKFYLAKSFISDVEPCNEKPPTLTCTLCLSIRYVQSWIDKREVQSEKANLTILFERYVPVVLEANRVGRFKKITPIQEV